MVPHDPGYDSSTSTILLPPAHSDNHTNSTVTTTAQLDAIHLETLGNKFTNIGLGPETAMMLMHQYTSNTITNKGYRIYQNAFIKWAFQQHPPVSISEFLVQDLINFLYSLHNSRQLKVGTLQMARSAVLHLSLALESIREHALLHMFFNALSHLAPPVSLHKPTIDMRPSIDFAQEILSSVDTSFFLLHTSTFFPALSLILTSVVAPKERRKKRAIIKPFTATTISAWLCRFINKSTTDTISIRSIASSCALAQGIALDDIVTLGNWTSSTTFHNHYKRQHMTTVDFTSAVLSGSSTTLSEPEDNFHDAMDTVDEDKKLFDLD
ncbi:hypothetical protein BDF14DRAFT_1887087 [Spinellus fusiger]|nr:hypothetical protein BDF14DRAFT_1887087 [Spinellus fusiger]